MELFDTKEDPMCTVLATAASLEMFTPLAIATGVALALPLLARFVGQRKLQAALDSTGGPLQPLEADRTEGPLSVVDVPQLNFERSITLLLEESEPSLQLASKSLASMSRSPADSAAMTMKMDRIYLDDRDLSMC